MAFDFQKLSEWDFEINLHAWNESYIILLGFEIKLPAKWYFLGAINQIRTKNLYDFWLLR